MNAGRRDLPLLLLAVIGTLALFLDKAFTIDDPLALWLARHLSASPADFFGFPVNWYSREMPMYEVTRNPPLVGYYIAGWASLLGWSERALHAAFLLPAAGVAAGTWLIARRLCARPLLAALTGLLTPVFLVSSTNVMCDTLMLAFWCASIACWLRGFDGGGTRWWLAGAGLAAVAALTKYFAISLIPLLLVHGWLRARRLGTWTATLLVPVAIVCGYELGTRAFYGVGLVTDAVGFVDTFRESRGSGLPFRTLTALVFAGGCLLPALWFAPMLWSRRALAGGVAVVGLAAALWAPLSRLVGVAFPTHDATPWLLVVQLLLMALAGVSLLGLAAGDLRRHGDAESWLLALWLLGTFVFAGFVNWVNNGRSILPMAPVFGILLVRRLDAVGDTAWLSATTFRRGAALAVSAALALVVTWADYRWANAVRDTARRIADTWVEPGRNTWFLGNWGFQYYMEAGGATTLDVRRHRIQPGDLLVLPSNNTNFRIPPKGSVRIVEKIDVDVPSWVRTVSISRGAGFYASNTGALPFAFGPGLPDMYRVLEARREFRFRDQPW